jgi:hypothetical protein
MQSQREYRTSLGLSGSAQRITSARIGGQISDQGVVLVDLVDVPGALKALMRAGCEPSRTQSDSMQW